VGKRLKISAKKVEGGYELSFKTEKGRSYNLSMGN
jgi:hypothetical protein